MISDTMLVRVECPQDLTARVEETPDGIVVRVVPAVRERVGDLVFHLKGWAPRKPGWSAMLERAIEP